MKIEKSFQVLTRDFSYQVAFAFLFFALAISFWPSKSQSQLVPMGFWKKNSAGGGGSPPPADSWVHDEYDLESRAGHVAVWTGSKMLMWGGGNPIASATYNNGAAYDPATDSWALIASTGAPSARCGATVVWSGTEMIVWGGEGDCAGGSLTNTGGRYNPSTDTWTATNTTGAPSARSGHSAVWTGLRMVIWGGGSNNGRQYHPGTNAWSAVTTTSAPSSRSYHTAVWTGTYMIVWGGSFGGTRLNTGGRYDATLNTWSATTTTGAPAIREYHTAVWTGTEMIVWGGADGSPINTGGRYNPSTNAWVATTTTNAPAARRVHSAVWTGTKMIIQGGADGTGMGLNTGGQYDPAADSWVATNTTGAPAQFGTSTVWTGTEMLVWGGLSFFFTTFNTGGRYNPSTDSWTNMSAGETGSTTAYLTTSSVWTGSKLMVFGGCELDFLTMGLSCGTRGAVYDPATDVWAPMTTSGAPTVKYMMSAVWTGTEMIVWGGGDMLTSSVTNLGGRYNPSTDTWTATSTTGAAGARLAHAAVWTGTKMLIWGGGDMSSAINTGGQYDPATNTWSAVTTTSAPAARYFPGVVWTGSLMLVWGGSTDMSSLVVNTGGRYNPSANTWQSITTTGAPTARYDHAAFWTGSRMLVWGGNDGGDAVNTGGRYDPTGNSWTAITTTNAPSIRHSFFKVWTGSQMIVWGGTDSSSNVTNTGGKYDPTANTWAATTLTDAPVAKYGTVSAWTGTSMLIWGGSSAFAKSQRLSFYYP